LAEAAVTRIPIYDPRPEVEELWDEITQAVQEVLKSGRFILGPQVKAFEQEVAAYLGVKHAIGVNSGTDALVIALRALGVGPGDEVVTTPFTFFATAEAISVVGATPVFVDIEPRTYNIDPNLIEERITPRTKAILPVHLYGQGADMAPLLALAEKHNLRIIEDAAQAFGGECRGQKLGAIGDVGCFSFFPTKNLGAYGDAGLLGTDSDEIARAARMLRAHGSKKKYFNEMIGYNSRLDELQAAILRVKLPHLDRRNEARRRRAQRYHELLESLPGLIIPREATATRHVYHQYTVRIPGGQRDRVQRHLAEAGIDTMVYYPVPLHRLPAYAGMNVFCPLAEALAEEVLSLPIWPQLEPSVQELVAATLRQALV